MTKPCAECGTGFEFKTHNQKYCSNQCCRVATNKRIMKKYYDKRRRLAGEQRECHICQSTLSKYNAEETCSYCFSVLQKNKTEKAKEDILNVIIGLEKKSSKKSSRN